MSVLRWIAVAVAVACASCTQVIVIAPPAPPPVIDVRVDLAEAPPAPTRPAYAICDGVRGETALVQVPALPP